jgi:hypothetical protein
MVRVEATPCRSSSSQDGPETVFWAESLLFMTRTNGLPTYETRNTMDISLGSSDTGNPSGAAVLFLTLLKSPCFGQAETQAILQVSNLSILREPNAWAPRSTFLESIALSPAQLHFPRYRRLTAFSGARHEIAGGYAASMRCYKW